MATTMAISGAGLTGALRMRWVEDALAHVLDHCETDEPSGTWTGLAGPDHALALGSDVDNTVLQRMCASGQVADMLWESPAEFSAEHYRLYGVAAMSQEAGLPDPFQQLEVLWSHAWAANYKVLELMQGAGLERFGTVKPQRWVIASFEHHCGVHGLRHPHVHNIVVTRLTTGTQAA